MMKNKIIGTFFILLLLSISSYVYSGPARDYRNINITYSSSSSVNVDDIIMNIKDDTISVRVNIEEGLKKYYDFENFEKEIKITEEYFDSIYQRFLNIDYSKIITIITTLPGGLIYDPRAVSINISIGGGTGTININLWSFEYDREEKNTKDLIFLLKELYSLFGLENIYFLRE